MNVTPTGGEKHVPTWTWEIRIVVPAMHGDLADVTRAAELRGGKHSKDILDAVEDFVAMYHTKCQNNQQGSCNAASRDCRSEWQQGWTVYKRRSNFTPLTAEERWDGSPSNVFACISCFRKI